MDYKAKNHGPGLLSRIPGLCIEKFPVGIQNPKLLSHGI